MLLQFIILEIYHQIPLPTPEAHPQGTAPRIFPVWTCIPLHPNPSAPCVATPGAAGRGTLQTFFNWYYTVLGLSIVFAATVIVYIQQARGWVVGFSVPSCSWSPRSRSSSSARPSTSRRRPTGAPSSASCRCSSPATRTATSPCRLSSYCTSVSLRLADGKTLLMR